MGRDRFTLAFDHHNMTPGPAGVATDKNIFKTEDGRVVAYGITVPTDGTTDPKYAPGCLFINTDADILFSGTVDSGDATSLIDATLTATFDTNDELIGLYVINTRNETMGLIDDYAQSTGDITVADWTNYAGTAVSNVAPNLPVAADPFSILRVAPKTAMYTNVGDRARGCKFRPVVDSYGGSYSATEMQKGPSESIWGPCPLLEIMLDPGKGFYYFNDFMGEIDITTTDGWTLTTVTTGAIAGVATIEGGAIIFDSAGNTTADDGIEAQLTNCLVLPQAGVTIRYEARVQMKDTGDDQYYIGLAGIDTSLMAAGVVDDVVDKCAWFRDSGASPADDRLTTIISRTSTENETADQAVIADDTWVKLGFVIDGLTSVKFYVNGELVTTDTTTASIPNAVMCLSFVSKVEQTSADAELTVDWVRLVQEGGRN